MTQTSTAFYRSEGMLSVFAPVTTGSISSPMGLGSDSVPVQAEIAGRPVYLADSMQFSLELAMRVMDCSAYYIMPSFRGEQADARHLNQFVHSEAEIHGDLNDVMGVVERYVRALAVAFVEHASADVEAMGGRLDELHALSNTPGALPRKTFGEAVTLLADEPGTFESCENGVQRLTNYGEQCLIKHAGGPVWVTHMPASTLPFYQSRAADNPEVSLTADLLMGIGETVGAGERAYSSDDLLVNLKAAQVDPLSYDWYLKMKELRPVKTAGFGLGVERFLMWATGTRDIRDWSFLIRNETGEGVP